MAWLASYCRWGPFPARFVQGVAEGVERRPDAAESDGGEGTTHRRLAYSKRVCHLLLRCPAPGGEGDLHLTFGPLDHLAVDHVAEVGHEPVRALVPARADGYEPRSSPQIFEELGALVERRAVESARRGRVGVDRGRYHVEGTHDD